MSIDNRVMEYLKNTGESASAEMIAGKTGMSVSFATGALVRLRKAGKVVTYGNGYYELPVNGKPKTAVARSPKPKPAPATQGKSTREKVCDLLNGGMAPMDIVRKLGVSDATVYTYRKELRAEGRLAEAEKPTANGTETAISRQPRHDQVEPGTQGPPEEKSSQNGSTAVSEPVTEDGKLTDGADGDLKTAFDNLEQRLGMRVQTPEIGDYQVKQDVLNRLGALLDPTIANVLDAISEDLRRCQGLADD